MRRNGILEEAEVVRKRFGDEQSSLLDKFERLSFEVHLNQAILARSLSQPQPQPHHLPPPPPPESTVTQGRGHRHHNHHRLRFQRVLKKLLKPIFIGTRKEDRKENIPPDHKNFKFIKAFSRSLRV